jgi:hypothetical protein
LEWPLGLAATRDLDTLWKEARKACNSNFRTEFTFLVWLLRSIYVSQARSLSLEYKIFYFIFVKELVLPKIWVKVTNMYVKKCM